MDSKNPISIQQFCTHYKAPLTFTNALQAYELVKITTTDNKTYLKKNQLNTLEKLMRLNYNRAINIDGMDAISNLLKRTEALQERIVVLNITLNRFKH